MRLCDGSLDVYRFVIALPPPPLRTNARIGFRRQPDGDVAGPSASACPCDIEFRVLQDGAERVIACDMHQLHPSRDHSECINFARHDALMNDSIYNSDRVGGGAGKIHHRPNSAFKRYAKKVNVANVSWKNEFQFRFVSSLMQCYNDFEWSFAEAVYWWRVKSRKCNKTNVARRAIHQSPRQIIAINQFANRKRIQ